MTSDNETQQDLEKIIEALLFIADEPITAEQIADISKFSLADVKKTLKDNSEKRMKTQAALQIENIAGGWRMVTDKSMAEVVQRLTGERDKKRLSGASLETLSIIAYKQPITRQEIEYIRGVNVDGALRSLVERGFVRISGRKDVPGRPLLYSSTKLFLDHFGLGGLKDLPRLAEFSEQDLDLPDSLNQPALETGEDDHALVRMEEASSADADSLPEAVDENPEIEHLNDKNETGAEL